MKKTCTFLVLCLTVLLAYSQNKKMEFDGIQPAIQHVYSAQRADVQSDEPLLVTTETPNGTLWLNYYKSSNEVTIGGNTTYDSIPYPNYPTYIIKVNRNKHLHGDLYLPSIIQNGEAKGARLVRIEDGALTGCDKLTSVIVPKTVVEIGASALRPNVELQAVVIPETVTQSYRNHTGLQVTAYVTYTQTLVVNSQAMLSDSLTYYSSGIKTLIVGDSVKRINSMNFMQCTNLTSVTLGKNVQEIGAQAFMGCSSLRSIHLPAGVKRIDKMAFHYGAGYSSSFTPTPLQRIEVEDYNTYKMLVDSAVNLQSYTRIYLAGNDITGTYVPKSEDDKEPEPKPKPELPEGATEIPDYFFANDTTLTSFIVPQTVTRIGNYAFYNCHNLESIVIPNSVTFIGSYAFEECRKIKELKLPAHIKVLNGSTFEGCISLSQLELNEELDSIGSNVVYRCPSLKSLTIPANVSRVNDHAFTNCNTELQVVFSSNKAGMTWANHMLLSSDKTILYDASNCPPESFAIPATVKDVRNLPYGITQLHFPASVEKVAYIPTPIQIITIDEANQSFVVADNVLYSKDMKVLIAIPQCVSGTYTVPETVDSICPYAVEANFTGYDTSYRRNFALSMFRLTHVLPTRLDLRIEYKDNLIYLLPLSYRDQYFRYWNDIVFDVDTYEPKVESPMKIGSKRCDYYSLKVKMSEWPAGSQPDRLVIDGLEYPFNAADSTFMVMRVDTIISRVKNRDKIYNYNSYLTYYIYPQKGSNVLPATDSVYMSPSRAKFDMTYSSDYTTVSGYMFMYDNHQANANDFVVECKISNTNTYPNNEIGTRTFRFSRSDMSALPTMSSRYGYAFSIDGLKPGYYLQFKFYGIYKGEQLELNSGSINIQNFVMDMDRLSCGTTTVSGRITFDAINLPIIQSGITGYGQGTEFRITGLTPGTIVPIECYATALIEGRDTTFRKTIFLPLSQLELTTLQVSNVNQNSARLHAATTIDEGEEAVGFEWRRYDAPEGMQSNRIDGTVYNEELVATLTGLDANTYYRYRPYLQTAGSTYYGEWLIFGTNSQSGALQPEVHTTEAVMTSYDAYSYILSGYVIPGSEPLIEQGFEYWPSGQPSKSMRTQARVEGAKAISAQGLHMTAIINNLQPLTRYQVRSYAKTASQTVYGETITLNTTTLSTIRGIESDNYLFDVYTTTGICVRHQTNTLNGLPHGLYIVNGQKIVVK